MLLKEVSMYRVDGTLELTIGHLATFKFSTFFVPFLSLWLI